MGANEIEIIESENILEQQAKIRPEHYWNDFTLEEIIESMTHWHSENRYIFKKYGYQKFLDKERLRYRDLATLLKSRLIDNNQNDSLKEGLINMKPSTDLSADSYNFLTNHLYPRIEGLYPREYVPTANHLWGMFEYSLAGEWIYHQSTEDAFTTKEDYLNNISKVIQIEKKSLKFMPDNSLIEVEGIHFLLLPFFDEVRNFIEYLKKEPRISRAGQRLVIEFKLLESQINEQNYFRLFYKTIPIITKLLIMKNRDKTLKARYQQYLNSWRIYHNEIRELPDFQIYYLPSPEYELEVTRKGQHGKVSKKIREPPTSKNQGGRPKGSFKRKC